jgi:hypothetical protein
MLWPRWCTGAGVLSGFLTRPARRTPDGGTHASLATVRSTVAGRIFWLLLAASCAGGSGEEPRRVESPSSPEGVPDGHPASDGGTAGPSPDGGSHSAAGPSALGTYALRTKATEARALLRRLFMSVAAYANVENVPGPRLPPTLPPTPARPSCEPQSWPADAAAGWAQLGFAPEEPVRFSYEVRRDETARTFSLRARGDLDCDGVLSTYELRGAIDANGEIVREPDLIVADELE